MGVSANGELLAIQGSSAVIRNSTGSVVASGLAHVTRIDTSSGNEGNMMWTDNGGDEGTGTHGFRGIEVTDDGSEVIVFGQHTGTMTLTDTTGSKLCKSECLYGYSARPKWPWPVWLFSDWPRLWPRSLGQPAA